MLHCTAEGDPTPQIQWDKNSQLGNLNKPRMIVMPNGTLYITEAYLSDEGKYGCIAGNSGGFKRVEVQLNVKGKKIYTLYYFNNAISYVTGNLFFIFFFKLVMVIVLIWMLKIMIVQ